MSLASLSVVFASLMIFGIFFLLIFNLYINTNALKQQPHLRVVCNEYLADFEVAEIGKVIEASGYANKIEFVSREDGLEQLKEWLEDDADVLDWMDESVVSPAYIVELKDPESPNRGGNQGASRLKGGVFTKNYKSYSRISKWIQIISVILF